MIYDIVYAPDPILKTVCDPIETVNDDVKKLANDMLETMYDSQGIGLAAPQIAIKKRMLVLDVDQDEDGEGGTPMVFINPKILHSSDEPNVYKEGCLSIPTHYAEIERPKIVRIEYLDMEGQKQEIEADGLLATCLQHEIDHLDGILFIDYLSSLKRKMIIKKMQKMKKGIKTL